MSSSATPNSRRIVLLSALILLVGLGVTATFWFLATTSSSTSASATPPDPRLSYKGEYLNIHPDVGYQGDEVCSSCHVEIARTYREHPMGRSMMPIADLAAKQDYTPKHRNPFDDLGVRMWVERKGDRIFHHAAAIEDSQQVWHQSQEVHHVVGSGTRGYSYLTELDGHLYQTPISWFSEKKIWDTSPGFPKVNWPGRPVAPGCLQCHADRTSHKPDHLRSYNTPAIAVHAIGCERCHGPGEKHVAKAEAGKCFGGEKDTSIVNPARLKWQLRENVCEQCHLNGMSRINRRGRDMLDFRPGLPLEEFFTILVKNPNMPDENKAVGQVEQMRDSKCFQKSSDENKLGCISCHDPHVKPSPEDRIKHFRDRCLTCHKQNDCSQNETLRRKTTAEDSCIVCHMPKRPAGDIAHTALTNHAIPRKPDGVSRKPAAWHPGELPVVNFYRDRLPANDLEVGRDMGIGLMQVAPKLKLNPVETVDLTRRALALLDPALKRPPNDALALTAKAEALLMLRRHEEGVKALRQAYQLEPKNEFIVGYLADLEYATKNYSEAKRYWREAIAIHPNYADYRNGLVTLLMQEKEWEQALEQARVLVKLEPSMQKLRETLVRCLLETGKKEEAAREFEILRKLRPQNIGQLEEWFKDKTK
jgi:Tfp pilus assembly protein PilF